MRNGPLPEITLKAVVLGLALAVVLGAATGVKQFFAVVAFVFFLWELGETRRLTLPLLVRALVSISGLLLFLAYCGWAFGQPLVSFQMDMATFHRHPSAMALVDVGHLLHHLGTRGGNTAAGTLVLLALGARPCLRGPRLHAILWCLATGVSTFFISADAYTPVPFASILRYQTMDLPLFLVAGLLLARLPGRTLAALLVPLLGAGLCVQARYAVDWWMWRWVA